MPSFNSSLGHIHDINVESALRNLTTTISHSTTFSDSEVRLTFRNKTLSQSLSLTDAENKYRLLLQTDSNE